MVLLTRNSHLAVLIFLYNAARVGPGVHLDSGRGGTRGGDEGGTVGGDDYFRWLKYLRHGVHGTKYIKEQDEKKRLISLSLSCYLISLSHDFLRLKLA